MLQKLKLFRKTNRKRSVAPKTEATIPAASTMLSEPSPTSSKWYQNIHELSMRVFKKVQLEGDLRALIIEGEPDAEALSLSWDRIVSAYHEAKGDITVLRRLVIYKEMSLLTINLREVYECVLILRNPKTIP